MLGFWTHARSADLVLERLDRVSHADLLLWLQLTIVGGGMLWCLALTLTLGLGGWYGKVFAAIMVLPSFEDAARRQ